MHCKKRKLTVDASWKLHISCFVLQQHSCLIVSGSALAIATLNCAASCHITSIIDDIIYMPQEARDTTSPRTRGKEGQRTWRGAADRGDKWGIDVMCTRNTIGVGTLNNASIQLVCYTVFGVGNERYQGTS
eukprot:scaffold92970_cov22-Prasinocladus_malaysianus.AAC.1